MSLWPWFASSAAFHTAAKINMSNMCRNRFGCVYLWVCRTVCVCADWSVRWWGALSWRPKRDAGGTVCHLPCHCIRMVSHHLLGRVQNTRTHPPTHTATHGCTQAHRSLEGRDEISSSSALHWDPETQTWRPWPYIWPHDPGIQMHSCSFCPFPPYPKLCCALRVLKMLISISVHWRKYKHFPLYLTTSFLASVPQG